MIYKLNTMATDRTEWRQMVKHALDTNGHWAMELDDNDDDDDDGKEARLGGT